MAKTDTVTVPDTGVILDDYIPEAAPGKYDDYVLAMLAADEQIEKDDPDGFAKGHRKAATVLSATRPGTRKINGKEVEVDLEIEKTRRLFQDSARAHDRTAKLIQQTPQGDGSVALKFVLAPKQKRPRKPAEEAATAE